MDRFYSLWYFWNECYFQLPPFKRSLHSQYQNWIQTGVSVSQSRLRRTFLPSSHLNRLEFVCNSSVGPLQNCLTHYTNQKHYVIYHYIVLRKLLTITARNVLKKKKCQPCDRYLKLWNESVNYTYNSVIS